MEKDIKQINVDLKCYMVSDTDYIACLIHGLVYCGKGCRGCKFYIDDDDPTLCCPTENVTAVR